MTLTKRKFCETFKTPFSLLDSSCLCLFFSSLFSPLLRRRRLPSFTCRQPAIVQGRDKRPKKTQTYTGLAKKILQNVISNSFYIFDILIRFTSSSGVYKQLFSRGKAGKNFNFHTADNLNLKYMYSKNSTDLNQCTRMTTPPCSRVLVYVRTTKHTHTPPSPPLPFFVATTDFAVPPRLLSLLLPWLPYLPGEGEREEFSHFPQNAT